MVQEGEAWQAVSAGEALRGEAGESKVPARIRRSWAAASAEISNMVLAAPDLYERSMILVRRTADTLRPECPDLASLLAFVDRAETRAAEAAEEAGVSTAGLRLDLVASIALAMRSREITGERTLRARLARVSLARDEGRTWAVVEQFGDPSEALVTPYRRIDVHVATGAALIASVEPDETFARAVYRLQWARLNPETGRLRPGEDLAARPDEYTDFEAWEAALAEAHRRLA
ncbi:MAG: hypothetical protein ACRDN9_14850 [Streptosporangiaceae bacterium]